MIDINDFGPFNIGNPNEITIKELSQIIIELTSSKSKISFKPLPEDDPLKRKPDISLAMKKLNWQPEIDLNKGLIETIKFFRK